MVPMRRLALLVVLPAVLALSACGGGDGTTTASPTATAGAGQGFRNGEDFQKIQECLTAAGITLPTPSGGFRGTPPSGAPRGTPPSGAPGDGGGGGGGFGGMFTDPDVQAALKACGITAPTGRPDGERPPSPSTA
jgi:hypothetical protein